MRTLRDALRFGLIVVLAVGFAAPAGAQIGFTFGSGGPSGDGLSIGAGPGQDLFKHGQKKLPDVGGKPAIAPKSPPLAPHNLATEPKLPLHPLVGNGAPPTLAPVKKIGNDVAKDHPITGATPKEDFKPKLAAPTPSPSEPKIIETKKALSPTPTPTQTEFSDKPKDELKPKTGAPPSTPSPSPTELGDKPKDDFAKPKDDLIKPTDKPTDRPSIDEAGPPVIVVPAPVPVDVSPPPTPLVTPPPTPVAATPVSTPPVVSETPPPKIPDEQRAVYAPPPFPDLDDCDECRDLLASILHYEQIIAEDSARLAEQQKQVLDLGAERDKIAADLVKASTDADRTYDQRMIDIDNDSIAARTAQNADLQKLIDEETRALDDRIAQYEACADRYCPETPPVVDEGPPTTVTKEPPPTPPSTPTPTNVAHSPPPTPPEAICGPDITEFVLGVLRDVRNGYNNNPDKQSAACHALLDPASASSAWDIFGLDPGSAPDEGTKYSPENDDWRPPDAPTPPELSTDDTPEQAQDKQDAYQKELDDYKRKIKKPWFTSYSKVCAMPRETCGATVEFLGTCQHAQVVNYVQWGMMMSLCGPGYPTVGKLAHAIWNHVHYHDGAPTEQQNNMADVGEELNDVIYHDPQNMQGVNNPRLDDIRKKLQAADAKLSHPEQVCALKCKLDPDQQDRLGMKPTGFHWAGLQHYAPSSTARELYDKAKSLLP
jgi:hypothetical protein